MDHISDGAGMFTLMACGPDFNLGEPRRRLAWRDEQNASTRHE